MPFYLPSVVLNPLSIRAFNALYYHTQVKKYATVWCPMRLFLSAGRCATLEPSVRAQRVCAVPVCLAPKRLAVRDSSRYCAVLVSEAGVFSGRAETVWSPGQPHFVSHGRLHAGARFPHTARAFAFWTTLIASCWPTAVACTSRKMRACSVTCSGKVIPTARNFSLLCKI